MTSHSVTTLCCFLALIGVGTRANTVKQIIEVTPELSELRTFFKNFNSDLFIRILSSNSQVKYTFFAPSNDAFSRLPKDLKDAFSRTSSQGQEKFKELMEYHTVEHFNDLPVVRSSDFTEEPKELYTKQSTKAFYFRTPQHAYINNARVTVADITASNGIVHIIDTVMNPVGSFLPLLAFVEENENTQFAEFAQLLKAHEHGFSVNCLVRGDRFSTIFVPTNAAFTQIPDTVLFKLRNSPEELQKVIDSHVVCERVLPIAFLNDTAPDTIPAVSGVIEVSVFGNDLYVKNDCVQGKVLAGSLTTSNGVLHPIDNILGFRHNNLLEEISMRDDLSRFYNHIRSSNVVRNQLNWQNAQGLEAPQEQIYTIFAATDSAMDGVDVTQMDLDNILHFNMIQGYYTVQDMQNNVQRNTLGINPLDNRLSQIGVSTGVDHSTGLPEIYVEVNHVVGKLLKGDICVKNGLLHIVDNLLGIPTKDTMDFIFDRPELNEFGLKINDVGLVSDISFQRLTIFAPTNAAFERMKQTDAGAQLLRTDYQAELRNLLLRHMVRGQEVIITDNNVPQLLQSELDDITISKFGGDFVVTFNANRDVRIIQRNIRTKTAVVHIIDEVMFEAEDLTAALTGRSSISQLSLVLLSLTLLSSFV